MIRDYLSLVVTSLRHRRLRSWLTMIGIFIGIATVISLIGLGDGLRNAITSQFTFLTTDILTIQASGLRAGPPGTGVITPLQESYVDDLEHITGVDSAIGRLIESAKLQFEGAATFTFVGSMPDGKKRTEVERIAQFELDQGRMLTDADRDRVVIGNHFTTADHFARGIKPRDKVLVQGKEFEVVGTLAKKGSFIVDEIILMNEERVRDLFKVNKTYDIIAVKVAPGHDLHVVKRRIESYLREERDVDEGKEDFTVESPEQEIANLNAILFAVQLFLYVIAGISIVVGGIGIANTMYTSVLERTKQIGIMKSIGAPNSAIFSLFVLESSLLGLVGGLIGIALGVGLAYGLAFVGQLALSSELIQVSLTLPLLLGALVFSILVGTIAGVLPALRAAHLKPVDALRAFR